ncbi:SnoaL-like protein [Lutibacter sp. Hel_I_33_5]|uniref:nuclear transport factor 2 family protein n=1 Tax=Lutibacter sp. Hel_I_33_5 TaxID=1566289 RepID=UPI0011A824D2|nr:nuclear transport factor 2 family protein [Lutibacter sp. Hel_I_33_5]TVZ56646.1 SnoaL-like protein [Lutibacter sp. Hel_I_33_5]
MKKVILLFFFFGMFFACKQKNSTTVVNPTEIKKTINTVLDDWHKAASEANYENYFRVLDSNSVYIGTDASENWTKAQFSEFSKPYFDKGKAWSFTALERNIYINKTNNTVWFDELLNTWMGTCRGSGVLEKTNTEWKIKHYVLSITIPNDDVKEIINIKKEKDSIFLNNYSNTKK